LTSAPRISWLVSNSLHSEFGCGLMSRSPNEMYLCALPCVDALRYQSRFEWVHLLVLSLRSLLQCRQMRG
jgi:hypothetical protein